jgi:hypothetical protein
MTVVTMSFLTLVVLVLLGYMRVVRANVLSFGECPPLSATSEYLGSNAKITLGNHPTFEFDVCAMHEATLVHARTASVQVTDPTNNQVLVNLPLPLCAGHGAECRAQLRAAQHPSCIYATKELTSHANTVLSTALQVPDNLSRSVRLTLYNGDGSVLAKFCGSYSTSA